MPHAVWKLDHASLGRGGSRLNDISLEICSRPTALLGCSGAGKSSLLSLLAGFERPVSGSIDFAPQPADGQLPLFWSPQDHGLWPHLTAEEHVAHVRPQSPRINRSVQEWLQLADLTNLASAPPDHMSQGERSRLSLIRTLASEAWAMLFDEPLVHVDSGHSIGYWNLIREVTTQLDGPLVYSTHDPESVLRFAEHVVCLDAGRVVFSGPVNQLYFEPPDRETAALLGPYNWFADDDLPPGTRTDWPRCVRPFEVSVIDDGESGPFRVTGATTIGGLMELTLQCVETQAAISISALTSNPLPSVGALVRLDFQPARARQVTIGNQTDSGDRDHDRANPDD
jgi:ABC-type multidrug transport system ATPase subunit